MNQSNPTEGPTASTSPGNASRGDQSADGQSAAGQSIDGSQGDGPGAGGPGANGLDDPRFDERGLPTGQTVDPTWEIGPRDVHRRIFRRQNPKLIREGDPAPVLVDCRTEQEVQLAALPGAMHIPVLDLPARVEELRAHAEHPVIVFCHHGRRSLQAAATLKELGFKDVRSMAGGIDLWSQSVDPTVPRY